MSLQNFRTALTIVIITAGIIGCSLVSCGTGNSAKTPLKVICAGSLIVPFNELEKAYEALHPDIDVLTEGHGSIQVIRQVTELGTEADIIAVADHSLIPTMMYEVKMPGTDTGYADWYIKFAANTLGLAYTANSKYAGEINAGNWYEILSRPGVKLGIPDPRFDSCGYRSLMVCLLAERLYSDDSILADVIGDFAYPITVKQDGALYTVLVPEVLKPEKINIRGSSIVLLGILESGDIDFAFEYNSVAQQHNLNFVELPPEINLGSDKFRELGIEITVELDYRRFATVKPVFPCESILYGITIPRNAPRPELAREYLAFLLGEQGQQIFAAAHQPLVPPLPDRPENLPAALKTLLEETE